MGVIGFVTPPETLPDDIAALQTALLAERAARQQAEAHVSGAEAIVPHLKLDCQIEARAVWVIDRARRQAARPAGITARGAWSERRRRRGRRQHGRAGTDDGASLEPPEAGADPAAGAPATRAGGSTGAALLSVLRQRSR